MDTLFPVHRVPWIERERERVMDDKGGKKDDKLLSLSRSLSLAPALFLISLTALDSLADEGVSLDEGVHEFPFSFQLPSG